MSKIKIGYVVATPEVLFNENLIAYQGDTEDAFKKLRDLGYEGAELMLANPDIVKIEDIIMEIKAIFVLYQGRKKASAVEKIKIQIHKARRRLITFQTILLASSLDFELVISLIDIAYNPKSAKNTKIQV